MLAALGLALLLQSASAPRVDAEVVSLEDGWRFASDPEKKGVAAGFAKFAFDDSKWEPIDVHKPWEAQGHEGLDGFAWYRRTFTLARNPEAVALLELGQIDDADEVYVNGRLVGSSGSFPPRPETAWTKRRAYRVPTEWLQEGANSIAVRVFDEIGDGGMRGGVHRISVGPRVAAYAAMRTRRPTGFPTANFALAMEMSTDGEFPARIWRNPSAEGAWLEEAALGAMSFAEGAESVRAIDALSGAPERAWPFAHARYESPRLPGVTIEIEAFCPIASVSEPYWSALPLGLATIKIANREARERTIDVAFDLAFEGDAEAVIADPSPAGPLAGFDSEALSARTNAHAASFETGLTKRWSFRCRVPANGASEARVAFARTPSAPGPKAEWTHSGELAAAGVRELEQARAATAGFEEWLPRTGDPSLDFALRAYAGAAAMLTKVLPSGRVVVMGYAEMTQRDGYWASTLHNVLFPELEQRMIDEIFLAQRADGKVPTSVFPTIDRGDDLDSNAYAILRAIRYARWHGDAKLMSALARNLVAAANWLRGRDADGDGLSEAGSYWCDWKDVPGMAGRKLSPHAVLVSMAALSQLAEVIEDLNGDAKIRGELEASVAKARATMNAGVEQGGLWTGRYYAERWKDGSVAPQVNEDQVVGVLLDVVPADRVASIFDALKPNRRAWGFRESFPYRPASFGYRGGDYANGGVWPWLNFADAWARFRAGRNEEALAILRDVAHQDLVACGESLPHECLDGENGENLRNAPQAWNADYFAAVLHGLFGVERLRDSSVRIAPRSLPGPGWRVRLPLEEGEIEVADGAGGAPPRVRWRLTHELWIRVLVPKRKPFEARVVAGEGSRTLE